MSNFDAVKCRLSAFELSDSQRHSWIEQNLKILSKVYGGNIITRDDSTELQISLDGRALRLSIHQSALTPTVTARVENRRGFLDVRYEEGASALVVDENDAWAESSDEERFFLGPDVFVDGHSYQQVVENFSEEIRTQTADFMKTHNLLVLFATMDKIEFISQRDLCQVDNLSKTVDEFFTFMARLVDVFEGAESWIGLGSGVTTGGNVQIAGVSQTVTCNYCNTLAILNKTSSCPTCGAPLTAS